MKNRMIALVLLLLALLVPCSALAAEQDEPTVYIVKKGDTLWGLSERFIRDPYYWPNMWSKNSQITNPHFIYPGQMVRVFSDHLEFVPKGGEAVAQKAQAPAPAGVFKDVAEEKTFLVRGSEGFLMEKNITPAGYVVGGHHDRIVLGEDDIVFTDIGTNNGAKAGDKFSVFRKDASVSHPLTSEIMGYKMVPLGTLQLTDVEQRASRAIITKSYKEISPGSYLMPYRSGKRHEISLKMPTRELKGYIIESYSGTTIIAAGDIVYIDLGRSQGVEPGNMLYVVRDVTIDQRYVQGRIDRLPQELLGALVVLETGQSTASALVVKSIDAIYKGDKLVSRIK